MELGHARRFALLDEYVGILLDADLARLTAGKVAIVETSRRLRRQSSYGFLHALWWAWFEDGRSVVSVPPGAGAEVSRLLEGIASPERLFDDQLADRLVEVTNSALRQAGLQSVNRRFRDLFYGCDATLLRRYSCGDCRRLTNEDIPPADGLCLPTHCFPDGVVYGVIAEGHVASVAYAHRSGILEDRVADPGVETAPGYRRRGYARDAVSALVEHFTARGGEALYDCRPDNVASISTARSVGFVSYGARRVLAAPAADA